jgi:hypothetical protein
MSICTKTPTDANLEISHLMHQPRRQHQPSNTSHLTPTIVPSFCFHPSVHGEHPNMLHCTRGLRQPFCVACFLKDRLFRTSRSNTLSDLPCHCYGSLCTRRRTIAVEIASPEVGNAAEVASDKECHLHMHAMNIPAFDHAARAVLETLLELTRYIDSAR